MDHILTFALAIMFTLIMEHGVIPAFLRERREKEMARLRQIEDDQEFNRIVAEMFGNPGGEKK